MAFIEAYVTNLGKYNEGELASEPLKFPTTTEEVQALLKRIGVDNIQYEEIFIADYGGDLPESISIPSEKAWSQIGTETRSPSAFPPVRRNSSTRTPFPTS